MGRIMWLMTRESLLLRFESMSQMSKSLPIHLRVRFADVELERSQSMVIDKLFARFGLDDSEIVLKTPRRFLQEPNFVARLF